MHPYLQGDQEEKLADILKEKVHLTNCESRGILAMVENDQCQNKEQQKEVGFLDLLIVLLKHKWMILSIVLLTTVISTAYIYIKFYGVKKAPPRATAAQVNLYYSDCGIESDLVPIDSINMILLSRTLTTSMSEAHKLKKIGLEIWDEKENKWMTVQTKTLEETGLFPTVKIKKTNNTITLSVVSMNNDLPQKLLNDYLKEISEYFRQRDLKNYESKLRLYRQQLDIAKDYILRTRLMDTILVTMNQLTRARSDAYYGFNIIDPPSDPISMPAPVPAPPSKQPNYGMVVLLLMLASFIIAVSLAFIIEYINNMRIREPGKYDLMKKYLRLNYRKHRG